MKIPKSSQHGLVMIAMLLLVFMAGTSMFFISMSDRHGDIKKQLDYNREMVSIKESLITFSANYPDFFPSSGLGPGRLPCPDRNVNGRPNNNCHQSDGRRRNRLPRYEDLETPALEFYFSTDFTELDSTNDEIAYFWYSVSANYVDEDPTTLNSSVAGLLTLNGDADYVAVIIDPGEVLQGRSRESDADKDTRNNYLEIPNRNSNNYIGYTDDPELLNDRAIGITRSELMSRVTFRVAQEIKKELDYDHASNGNQYPPYQDNTDHTHNPFNLSDFHFEDQMDDIIADWYEDDEWDLQTTYTRIDSDTANIQFTDCNIVYTLRFSIEPKISRSQHSC